MTLSGRLPAQERDATVLWNGKDPVSLKGFKMFKEKNAILAAFMLMGLILAAGNRELLSQTGPADETGPTPWTFLYPTDGSQTMGPASFLGAGPANETGILSVYTQDDDIPGGTYPSELTLKRLSFVSTEGYDMWNGEPYGWNGAWFACIVSANLSEGLEDPLNPDPNNPQVDVHEMCEGFGGDGVSYSIDEEMPM